MDLRERIKKAQKELEKTILVLDFYNQIVRMQSGESNRFQDLVMGDIFWFESNLYMAKSKATPIYFGDSDTGYITAERISQ